MLHLFASFGGLVLRRPGIPSGIACFVVMILVCEMAMAQMAGDPWQGLRIDAVRITLIPQPESGETRTALEDRVRRALDLFPGTAFRNLFLDWGLSKLKSEPWVGDAQAELMPGDSGGVVIEVRVTVSDQAKASARAPAFPNLHQGADSLVKVKLMASGLAYANHNAWYGQPGAFVGANPLASKPAGAGWAPWAEGATEVGIQGIGPITSSVYAYGSLSWLQSGSVGSELFTNEPRTYGGLEDAYAGLIFGKTWNDGARLVFNLSAGRQPFQIADGMLIRITAGNGFDRAGLQLNPRWAADNLLLAEARYNTWRIQTFQLDPDELPAIDSRTIINGVNIDAGLGTARQWGLTWLYVPQSDYGYYTPSAAGTRAGLEVIDARLSWLPTAPGGAGPYAKTELGYQINHVNSFPMRAWAGYVEGGYTLAGLRFSPSLSYRLSYFSGDNPATTTYERWDPLLSGGTPEEWVQGINHYNMFQDSNVIAQRIQVQLRPSRTTEVVPQLWLFNADQTNNLGGTLAQLAGRTLGWELNLTGKYYPTRHLYFQGSIAITGPLSGVDGAVDGHLTPWVSAMLLALVNY
jgi:hypothetical protein